MTVLKNIPKTTLSCFREFGQHSRQFSRKKTISATAFETSLRRCLTTFDITLIGVGMMIGAGIYVLTGREARQTSGPAIVVAYAVSGFVSLLAALCYAEFGAKVPKAGSAYAYTYVTIGEFWAFLIGWNIILEYVIAGAAVSATMSSYIWTMVRQSSDNISLASGGNGSILLAQNFSVDTPLLGEIQTSAMNAELDWLAAILVLIFGAIMALGVRGSTNLNSFCTLVNLAVLVLVVGFGFTMADGANWTNIPGGFIPYGYQGLLKSSATCFFAYVGFDIMATAAEEARDPGRSVPVAIMLAMGLVTTAYCLMSSVLTLMVPYNLIDPEAAFATVFASKGAHWAKYTVSVGAVTGMITTMLGDMFILPRAIYALAVDGLLFKWLAYVSPKTKAPLAAIAVAVAVVSVIAMTINVDTLIDMLAVGTLNAYSWVSASVLVLRYSPGIDPNGKIQDKGGQLKNINSRWDEVLNRTLGHLAPGAAVRVSMLVFVLAFFALGVTVKFIETVNEVWILYVIVAILAVMVALSVAIICVHTQNSMPLKFKVWPVPLLPLTSVALNIVLVCSLDPLSWARFLLWTTGGWIIYFGYGYWHSEERKSKPVEQSNDIFLPTESAVKF